MQVIYCTWFRSICQKLNGTVVTWCLIEGELDNTFLGKVTGWMRFLGVDDKVTLTLKGDFHRDIRGTKIRFKNKPERSEEEAKRYMKDFAREQTGHVGDMTAGLPPQDYISYPYLEWYGVENGRVMIELEPDQVEVMGTLRPYIDADPISRRMQAHHMTMFLAEISQAAQRSATAVGSKQTPRKDHQDQDVA